LSLESAPLEAEGWQKRWSTHAGDVPSLTADGRLSTHCGHATKVYSLRMADDKFIERVFEVDGAEIACRFFTPVADGNDFRCRYSIDHRPAGAHIREIPGVDGVQALLLAMEAAHADLLLLREQEGRTVRWLGGSGLGLPISTVIQDLDVGMGSTAPTRD
jgi:hypothetical protein